MPLFSDSFFLKADRTSFSWGLAKGNCMASCSANPKAKCLLLPHRVPQAHCPLLTSSDPKPFLSLECDFVFTPMHCVQHEILTHVSRVWQTMHPYASCFAFNPEVTSLLCGLLHLWSATTGPWPKQRDLSAPAAR